MSQGYSSDPNNPYNQSGNANIPNPYGVTGPPNPQASNPPTPPPYNSNYPYGPNPYSSDSGHMHPPPNSGSRILLYVLGGVAAFLMLGCCGMCGLFYFAAEVGFSAKSTQLQKDFTNHPIVKEELGGLDEVQHNWSGTINEDAADDLVFDVKGPKGKGQLIVTEEGFGDEQTSVRLRTTKGEWELLQDPQNQE